MAPRLVLLLVTTALASIGVMMVYSAGITSRPSTVGETYLTRHLMAVGSSLVGLLLASSMSLESWRRAAIPFLLVAVVLLGLVLVPGIGTEVNGARRWLRIGPVNFQPSELAKLGMVLFLAYLFSRRLAHLRSLARVYVPVLALMGLVCGLILLEPDFGTAVLIGVVCMVLCFAAGIPKLYLYFTIRTAILGGVFLILACPYRLTRFTGFLNIWTDPLGSGYHARQSLLSLGSGGLTGAGLGAGQQKLSYLPEAPTDFIFGVIGEELGLAGTILTVVLFVIFLMAAIRIVRGAVGNPFAFLLAAGISCQIAIQALLNIAVVTAVIPTKGLALPFVSYGGSNLFINMLSVGVLVSIAKETSPDPGLEPSLPELQPELVP